MSDFQGVAGVGRVKRGSSFPPSPPPRLPCMRPGRAFGDGPSTGCCSPCGSGYGKACIMSLVVVAVEVEAGCSCFWRTTYLYRYLYYMILIVVFSCRFFVLKLRHGFARLQTMVVFFFVRGVRQNGVCEDVPLFCSYRLL